MQALQELVGGGSLGSTIVICTHRARMVQASFISRATLSNAGIHLGSCMQLKLSYAST